MKKNKINTLFNYLKIKTRYAIKIYIKNRINDIVLRYKIHNLLYLNKNKKTLKKILLRIFFVIIQSFINIRFLNARQYRSF